MKYTKLFKMQEKLDQHIIGRNKLDVRKILPDLVLGLQVELGECAQEWREFKHWSLDRKPRTEQECHVCHGEGRTYKVTVTENKTIAIAKACTYCGGSGVENPLLGEYVDCLHFILSIGNWFGFQDMDIELGHEEVTEVDKAFIDLNMGAGTFIYELSKESVMIIHETNYRYIFSLFARLGKLLGFEWEEIELAYKRKNKLNHSRQKGGY